MRGLVVNGLKLLQYFSGNGALRQAIEELVQRGSDLMENRCFHHFFPGNGLRTNYFRCRAGRFLWVV